MSDLPPQLCGAEEVRTPTQGNGKVMDIQGALELSLKRSDYSHCDTMSQNTVRVILKYFIYSNTGFITTTIIIQN